MNLFDEVYERNKDIIENMIALYKGDNFEKEIKKTYVESSVFLKRSKEHAEQSGKEHIGINCVLGRTFVTFKFLYLEKELFLNRIELENRDCLSILELTRSSTIIRLVNKKNIRDSYILENRDYTIKKGTIEQDYVFREYTGSYLEKTKVENLEKTLTTGIENLIIKESYLDHIFIQNLIKKKTLSKELQEMFFLTFDYKMEDHSQYFNFDINKKFNILKKDNTFIKKIKSRFNIK